MQFAADVHQQLADARFLDRKIQPHKSERRCLRSEKRRRAERPDHFVVTHVDYPQIAVGMGAIAGNGQNDMRVDSRNSEINDLKVRVRKPLVQQRFQITRRGVRRLRLSSRGRLSQYKNAVCVGGFPGRHHDGSGPARQLRRKESQAEIFIVDQKILLADANFFKEAG